MADRIATCPLCPGKTHRAGRWVEAEKGYWPPRDRPLIARVDGGDPGDEQAEVRR